MSRYKSTKIPWPTKAVMQQIYDKHLWGGNGYDYYSGIGSHQPEIIKPYIKAIIDFLKSIENKISICDLGCGDFNVGKHLFRYSKKYIAVDIIEELIKRNASKFKADNLEFMALDISKDKLPQTDCIIIRQVLQHLSNSEILQIINRFQNYKYILLTEHIPTGDFEANKDKISSQGIRLKQNSGVDILATPFNVKVTSKKLLDTFILKDGKSQIQTLLLTL